jgi:hypothetical protein
MSGAGGRHEVNKHRNTRRYFTLCQDSKEEGKRVIEKRTCTPPLQGGYAFLWACRRLANMEKIAFHSL